MNTFLCIFKYRPHLFANNSHKNNQNHYLQKCCVFRVTPFNWCIIVMVFTWEKNVLSQIQSKIQCTQYTSGLMSNLLTKITSPNGLMLKKKLYIWYQYLKTILALGMNDLRAREIRAEPSPSTLLGYLSSISGAEAFSPNHAIGPSPPSVGQRLVMKTVTVHVPHANGNIIHVKNIQKRQNSSTY